MAEHIAHAEGSEEGQSSSRYFFDPRRAGDGSWVRALPRVQVTDPEYPIQRIPGVTNYTQIFRADGYAPEIPALIDRVYAMAEVAFLWGRKRLLQNSGTVTRWTAGLAEFLHEGGLPACGMAVAELRPAQVTETTGLGFNGPDEKRRFMVTWEAGLTFVAPDPIDTEALQA